MISSYVGGEHVRKGLYWCSGTAEFVSIPSEGGTLEGSPRDRYIGVPLPLVLTVGPLMGLAFIVFLPVSGLLVLGPFLAAKMRRVLAAGRIGVAQVASGPAQPGVSYLEPRAHSAEPSVKVAAGEGKPDGKLFDMAREIADKRWREN